METFSLFPIFYVYIGEISQYGQQIGRGGAGQPGSACVFCRTPINAQKGACNAKYCFCDSVACSALLRDRMHGNALAGRVDSRWMTKSKIERFPRTGIFAGARGRSRRYKQTCLPVIKFFRSLIINDLRSTPTVHRHAPGQPPYARDRTFAGAV